jgi:hypothetical protein
MTYSRAEDDGRALAYIGSIFLSVGIVVFGGIVFLFRELRRNLRERGREMWQPASAQITSGDVKAIHGRGVDYAIGSVGYAYSVQDTYYSGYLERQFWDEQSAWTFVDGCQNRPVMIKYKPNKPQTSLLALRDLCRTETQGFASTARTWRFSPWLALLWSFRNVSDWAEGTLQKNARLWPSVEAVVEYAEPMMVGDEDDLHWVGDLHYKYSVDGSTYSASHYFRASGQQHARERVQAWRGEKLIIHCFPGNASRSVFIENEQHPSTAVQNSRNV